MEFKDIKYEHKIHARAFLDRAIANLEVFDFESKASCLFYAALELRFGIEARLFEYLEATLKSQKKDSSTIKEYIATKLLKKLTVEDENADKPVTLSIPSGGEKTGVSMQYTPVTKELAQMHGKLGELLHFKFFRNNRNWYIKIIQEDPSFKSLIYFRNFLEDVVNELKQATSGMLLTHPRFTEIINEVIDSEN